MDEWQDSSGNVLLAVNAGGGITVGLAGLLFKNAQGVSIALLGPEGNLCLKGKVYENVSNNMLNP